jgi:23S rRNA pseudouridine1911/1915/1917 synthase
MSPSRDEGRGMTDRGLLTHTVRGTDVDSRIDILLAESGLLPSRAVAQKLIERNCVRVNGQTVNKRYRVRSGERITVEIPPASPSQMEAEDVSLDIRFEDDDMIVLSKPAGMVVHPAHGHWSGTLVNALLSHSDYLGTLAGEERPGIVHRLDKDTSGLMRVAKNDDAQRALSSAIKQRLVDRRYIALVHGRIAPDSGLVDAPIGRHQKDRQKMWVTDASGSRQAVTSFRVLERFEAGAADDGYTLVECKLQTGRTHQIRVHMAYIEHAVVGDPVYGRRRLKEDLGLTRQFLHAYRLAFTHPRSGEEIELTDPVSTDLAAALAPLSDRSEGVTEAGRDVLGLVTPSASPCEQTG